MPEDELRQCVARLQAAEFLCETSLFPESEYTFKHGLTRQVAYDSLLQERRRARHAQLVTVMEQLYTDRLAEQVERLAHHALAGEVWDKAAIYLHQAGSKAAGRSANLEAVTHFEHGVDALRHLPETRQTLEEAIDLRLDLRNALLPLGEFARILQHLREAEKLVNRLGDQPRLGRITCYLADYFRQMGDHQSAIEAGRRSLTIAATHQDLALEVASNIYVGQVYHDMGLYRKGAASFRRNVESLGRPLLRERFGLPYVASVHSRTWLVLCLAELGEFAEGIRRAEEALQIAEAVEHAPSLTSAYAGLGRVRLRKGDLPAAIAALERGLELARRWNIRFLFPQLAESLGSSYALAGRLPEARPLLEQALAQHASTRRTAAQSLRVASLGQAHLLAGRTEDARRLAERALDLARSHGERGHQAQALHLLGEITASLEPADLARAEAYFCQAMAVADELDMRPLSARGHLGLGTLLARAWRGEQARVHLTTAATMFREMDMPRGLEQSEAELKALR